MITLAAAQMIHPAFGQSGARRADMERIISITRNTVPCCPTSCSNRDANCGNPVGRRRLRLCHFNRVKPSPYTLYRKRDFHGDKSSYLNRNNLVWFYLLGKWLITARRADEPQEGVRHTQRSRVVFRGTISTIDAFSPLDRFNCLICCCAFFLVPCLGKHHQTPCRSASLNSAARGIKYYSANIIPLLSLSFFLNSHYLFTG